MSPGALLALVAIGVACGVATALVMFGEQVKFSTAAVVSLLGCLGAVVGSSAAGYSVWQEAIAGLAKVVADLARSGGKALVGGIFVLPSVACGLLFSFLAALVLKLVFIKPGD